MATISTFAARQTAFIRPRCALEHSSSAIEFRRRGQNRRLPGSLIFSGGSSSIRGMVHVDFGVRFSADYSGLNIRSSGSGVPATPVPNSGRKDGSWGDVVHRLTGSQAPPSLSDIVWPSLGGFIAMAAMGHVDAVLAPRGLSFTMGSFGAVCTLLFAAPKSPVSQKYNVYVSHLGCAAVGVLALVIFGPGWIARAVSLAAAIAFMQYTGSLHPPAAGLPLIMLDVPKMHQLQWWYVIYPGVIGCGFLFLMVRFWPPILRFICGMLHYCIRL